MPAHCLAAYRSGAASSKIGRSNVNFQTRNEEVGGSRKLFGPPAKLKRINAAKTKTKLTLGGTDHTHIIFDNAASKPNLSTKTEHEFTIIKYQHKSNNKHFWNARSRNYTAHGA